MKRSLLILLGNLLLIPAFAQVNVPLLHQLVANSQSEHSRQQDARNNQTVATANEAVNKSQLEKLKNKYRELKNRFHTVGMAIDAAQIGIEASPVVTQIIRWQEVIYDQATDSPVLVALALQTEIDLCERARRLAGYIAGLALSAGDLGQMKASDRKILFAHALTQLRQLEGTSRGLAMTMRNARRTVRGDPFAGFVNQDKRLVEEIVKNVRILKN